MSALSLRVVASITLDRARGVALSGAYAFVAEENEGALHAIDVSDPNAPAIVGTVTGFSTPRGVTVHGDYAYVGEAKFSGGGLSIVDVSDPANPSTVGRVGLNSSDAVAVAGDYAYVSRPDFDALAVVDVSDPDSPSIAGSVSASSLDAASGGVAVRGDYAYVAAGNVDSLTVVDVSDPENPSIAGSVSGADLNGAVDVAVSGDYAYVTARFADALTVVDVSTPASPSIVGTASDTSLNGAFRVVLDGDRAYVTAFDEGAVTVVDVSDSNAPAVVASVSAAALSTVDGIAVDGIYAYVGGGDAFAVVSISELQSEFRVRGNLSEDAGSLLDSVQANAVDASIGEALPLGFSYDPQKLALFIEAMRPDEIAARYYPIPRQSTEFLNDYGGETILSRMERVYPPAIFGTVEELGLDTFDLKDGDENVTGQAATAQTVIAYIFNEWASKYAWFRYATVPDLRLKVENPEDAGIATPAQYEDKPKLGRAYSEIIQFSQGEDERKTMRQILDELLSPFYGSIPRVNSSGELEIVPTYGPDASNDPAVTMTTDDAYQVSRGQPSPQGVINSWTFKSQPYVETEDGGLLNQSWFQFAHPDFPSGELYADGTGEDISSDDPHSPNAKPGVWSPQSGRIPGKDSGIKLTDSDDVKQVTIDWKRAGGGSGSFSAGNITLADIPTDGSWVRAISAEEGVAGAFYLGSIRVNVDARYDDESNTVQFGLPGDQDLYAGFTPAPYVVRFNLLDATDVWQADTTTVTGSYTAQEAEDNPLPGNPVSASIAAYGERARTVNITGWGITSATQLERMARAAVFEAIQPKLVRTVDQSVWRAFPVRPDHLGLVIEIPGGEQGRLPGRNYSDDYGSNFGDGQIASNLKVEIIDADGDGALDLTTAYLLDELGNPLVDESGVQLEDE